MTFRKFLLRVCSNKIVDDIQLLLFVDDTHDSILSHTAFVFQPNVPEVFRNCVDTFVKIRLVEKVRVCKVCGFSVPATDSLAPSDGGGERALLAHVMEHSLKELYETGHTIPQW